MNESDKSNYDELVNEKCKLQATITVLNDANFQIRQTIYSNEEAIYKARKKCDEVDRLMAEIDGRYKKVTAKNSKPRPTLTKEQLIEIAHRLGINISDEPEPDDWQDDEEADEELEEIDLETDN